jgi:RND family efflux transporter MFP subunit
MLVPLSVLLAVVGVIAWSAWPLLRPAREIEVVQAVFDSSAPPTRAPSSTAADAPGKKRDIPTVQAAGWLEAEPFYVAATALADGVVETVHVLEGEYVEQGEVVARLIAEDSEIRLRRAEADLRRARAMLASARAEAAAAQASWDEPVELDRALASSRAAIAESEAELARLPSRIAAARATLERLEEEAARVRRSTDRGAGTEFESIVAQQREAAQRAEVAALEGSRAVLEARVDRLRAESRAAERNLELRIEDRRRLDAARASVATAQAAVDHAEAARDEAALELERMTIRAPITGYVQKRFKVPGDKAVRRMDDPESAHIAHLYDPEQLRVRVDVPLADASHIFIGQPCEVIAEVLPNRVFEGEVLRTTHEADLQKNTLEIHVKVSDPAPTLRPEMLTRVKFLPPSGEDANQAKDSGESITRVRVPKQALTPSGDRVWLVKQRRNGRGTLAPTPVRVEAREGDWATVSGQIRPGDLLAIGVDRPREGERVVIERNTAPDGKGSS